ncbi:MAG: Ig-like domain-containing protein [Firmicutes bacterium]|nr:Ig-like domain-containing protein [Bacillota bacterium]
MKKFLISVIFIIPIIIVLTLNAAGTLISRTSPVNARDLKIYDASGRELTANSVITVSTFEEFRIRVEILPAISYDRDITYVHDDIDDSGEVKLVRQGNTHWYSVEAIESGTARLLISPSSNTNIRRALNIIVRSTVIREMRVFDGNGARVETLSLNGGSFVYGDIHPADALDGEQWWESANPSVVTVSRNGFLTPQRNGETTVFLKAWDKEGNLHEEAIRVSSWDALVKTNVVYASQEVSEEWIRANILVNQNATVSGGGNKFTVTHGTRSEVINIYECGENDIEFSEHENLLYTNNGAHYIGVRYKDMLREDAPDFTLTIAEDEDKDSPKPISLLGVRDGQYRIQTNAHGSAVIEAESGGEKISTTITVREKPLAFNLLYNSEDYRLGIRQTRDFALNFYNNKEGGEPDIEDLISTIQFGATVLGSEEGGTDFLWESSDKDALNICENAKIEFKKAGLGKSITVTAFVQVYNYLAQVRRSFTFNIYEEENAVNCYTYEEVRLAYEHGFVPVVQNDIQLLDRLNGTTSIIGNGFLLDGRGLDGGRIIEYRQGNLAIPEKDIFVIDIVGEGADHDSYDENSPAGLRFVDIKTAKIFITNVILQYLSEGVVLEENLYAEIEGSIIGDCALTAFNIRSKATEDDTLVFTNVILKTTGGPSMVSSPVGFDAGVFKNQYLPKMYINGFMDIYNWVTPEQLQSLIGKLGEGAISDLTDGVPALDATKLFEYLAEFLTRLLLRPENASLFYYDVRTGQNYVNLGSFFIGLYGIADASQVVIEDKSLTLLPITVPRSELRVSPVVFAANAAVQLASKMEADLMRPSYILTYNMADAPPKNRPGDPIPQNEETFNKLTSVYR